MMYVNIEGWLRERGFDIDALDDEEWDRLESVSEELAQETINGDMDTIGNEIVAIYRLKKVNE
jgi:hypothetical protein